ncbi:hypothetical protein [Streptomyces alanosinicus]|uniref:Uncharacterized protein n=1 Tax=Streptomyces alanosinicus TaxID=68171 RepID=A0A918YS87_9ACTN|nr:hypothetical protein [Streptomyces alanosinicus]GHE14787.1 hypothetical protein GCM10010339_87220 [Streptomyces alanosinicus]
MVGDVVPQAPEVVHGLVVVIGSAVEHAGWLAGAAGAALITWTASAAWWRRRAVRELGRRARFELVPAVTFDPQLGDIGQAAARLDGARAAASGVPRRAAAVRIRVWAGPERQLHYGWEGPQQAASLLRMPSYRQVDVRPADTARETSARVRFEGVSPQAGGW